MMKIGTRGAALHFTIKTNHHKGKAPKAGGCARGDRVDKRDRGDSFKLPDSVLETLAHLTIMPEQSQPMATNHNQWESILIMPQSISG